MAHRTQTNPSANRGDAPPPPGRYLSGISFPASKAELLQLARDNGADDDVLDALEGLPNRTFRDLQDVLVDYGPAPVHGRAGEAPNWHSPKKK